MKKSLLWLRAVPAYVLLAGVFGFHNTGLALTLGTD
jgi:hypothetical protein